MTKATLSPRIPDSGQRNAFVSPHLGSAGFGVNTDVRALNKRDLLTLVAAVNHEPGMGSRRFASAV